MTHIIERIPEGRRNAAIKALDEKARGKVDEINFLVCEIDEAERLKDARTALKKADDLLKVKPGHHRALEVRQKYSGYGEEGAALIGVFNQFRRPLNDGGWIPWSVLGFGLAVLGVMAGAIFFYFRGTAIIVDVQDPELKVAVKGSMLTVTGPNKEEVTVEPGNQELTITYRNLKLTSKSFSLKRGEKKVVTIDVVDEGVVLNFDGARLSLVPQENAGGTGPISAKPEVTKSGIDKSPEKNGSRRAVNVRPDASCSLRRGDCQAWARELVGAPECARAIDQFDRHENSCSSPRASS